ncbi:glycosyltransferase [Spirosoma endbachense]|uniref:Glycosyltransferase n=1 Tax=Spirosoma endbachense TaxID=2666025 RepID=A0A6P1VTF4_9BACT|nr:glycosyltransferase [Spirosoma endbachense]QHV95270.1 glycosyltransferase [Spirosoma endbachense]
MAHSDKIILNLSALDYSGAGKFAVDFSQLLQKNGLQSYLVVKDSKVGGEGIIAYQDSSFDNALGKFQRKSVKKKLTDDLFAYDYYFYNKYETLSVVSAQKILALIPKKPDVIFIHWVTDFINAKIIHELHRLTKAKIYWLVIDNAPLTGGCHYPWTCDGYTRSCSSCPAIRADEYKWIAEKNLSFKKKYLPDDLCLITFSQSDFVRAKQSSLFRDKHVLKLVGFVDEEKFTLGDKAAARRYFNVPADKTVLFFGASSLKEKRKGMQLLLDALTTNPTDEFTLLIAGEFPTKGLKGNVRNLGYLDEDELVIAYQAATVFICPSVEDSGPMMINQSLMCGTPVVAFDTGVAQDLVIFEQTGYRAKLADVQDLAKGIAHVVNRDVSSQVALQSRCRTMALQAYGRVAFINKLMDLVTA